MGTIYEKYGARMINAHGTMLNNKSIVPRNTILIFLTRPGYCTALPMARKVYHDYFESNENIRKFLSGNVPKKYLYVSNIKNRTHYPGHAYHNMTLAFNNKKLPSLGYVRKLPLTRQHHILGHYLHKETNVAPTFAETLGPIPRGTRIRLSDVLKKTGPGVYIIASCRRTLENKTLKKTPMNIPERYAPEHPTDPRLRRSKKRNNWESPHPGAFNFSLHAERSLRKPRRPVSETLKRVLTHMSRTKAKEPFMNYIGPLPANLNAKTLENLKKTYNRLVHL